MGISGRVCVVFSIVFASGPSSADASLAGQIGQVLCRSKSLTICQDEFCFVTFDPGDDAGMSFDFGRNDYVNPTLGPGPKPMRAIDVKEAKGTFQAKFRIDLQGGPANVQFVANQQDDGSFKMTAARRFAYPAKGDRAPIVVITGMECGRHPD